MKQFSIYSISLFLCGSVLAEPLVSLNNERIVEIATEILVENREEVSRDDLRATVIDVVSHPKQTDKHRANITVGFIVPTTEQLDCTPPSNELSEALKRELQEDGCTKYYTGYTVGYSTLHPKRGFNIRRNDRERHWVVH